MSRKTYGLNWLYKSNPAKRFNDHGEQQDGLG